MTSRGKLVIQLDEAAELREQRSKIAGQMTALAKGGLPTPADAERFAALDKEQNELRQRIERIESSDSTERMISTMFNHYALRSQREGVNEQLFELFLESGILGKLAPSTRQRFHSLFAEARDVNRRLKVADLSDGWEFRYREAFESYLRRGLHDSEGSRGCTQEQRQLLMERRMDAGGQAAYPGATAGFFVPMDFQDQVTSAMKYIGPMLALATITDTQSGAPRPYPTDNDTTVSGEQVAEDVQVTAQDIGALNQVILGSYKYSSRLVKVSLELVQDAGFDLMEYLAERLGIRLGRILNTKFTTGSGTGEPNGIVTVASVGRVAVGSASNTGGSETAANSVGSDDLVALEQSVDPVYRPGAQYQMHPATWAYIRGLRDKQGRPIYKGDVQAINGYPVALNPSMAQFPTSSGTNTTVLFGNFRKYQIRRAPALVHRMKERFAEYGQIAFLMLQRYDGNLIDGGGGAVKALTNTM